ncbi:hypothetical protein PAPYR_11941 [Paratrimastix pyriformis]|uniref:ParB/Sulfiredoxin domain-containing protein n=1 Tax=Paratrimastix pyriformis TaxID=342808 RepID=A0ABQ8U559_9EUKA|nr:hypothetical protein PAPYR_11941 [Paratrimastix pyriformis]
MNSIDWNQFRTPEDAIAWCEGTLSLQPPGWAEAPHVAINWFVCLRPAATHTAEGAPPAPTAPTAPLPTQALPIEHKDKATGAARVAILDDDDASPSPKPKEKAKPKPPKKAPEEEVKNKPKPKKDGPEANKKAPVAPTKPKKDAAPVPPPPARRRKPGHHEANKEASDASEAEDQAAEKDAPPRHRGTKHQAPVEISSSSDEDGPAPEPKAKAERKRGRPNSPELAPEARQLIQGGLFNVSLPGKSIAKRAQVLLSSIDPCPSLARPLSYERLAAIIEWFNKLGASVLFSIIVQKSPQVEARYQVVDGSHRFQVARIIVDPRRVSELPTGITAEQRDALRERVEKLNEEFPKIRKHLKEDYIDVAVYNTLEPEAMLELQHRVNLLTHDARFGSSTFDVLLNLKRASLQAPKLYSLDHPDLDTLLAPALSELHFPKSVDAPSKLLKMLASFSLDLLCELSRLPVERQPSPTNLWRIFEARDLEMNCWVARALLQGSFSGSEANSVVAPEMKKPIRQAEQTFLLLEAHDAAEVADGNRQPTFAFMNCLNVRPFQIRKGKVRLPAFTEMLGELGCPFERLNETDVRNLPLEITCIRIDGRSLTDFDLVLGYWLGWCAAQLPPAMQDYLRPEHCNKRTLKTVDRELREEKRALREEASEHPEPPKSEPAKRATLKALLSQAEPTSEAEAKAAEAERL